MNRSALLLFLGFVAGIASSCKTDSEEALLRAKAEADSLLFNIPTLTLLSPSQNDTVEVPFTITYRTENWEISPNGRHVQYFINGENKGLHFGENSLTLQAVDTGSQQVALELAREDFSLTGVLDSVRVYVKPPPPSTFSLVVNQGTGSGNYSEGQTVTIAAIPSENTLFDQWTGDVAYIANLSDSITTVVMPDQNIELTATFALAPVAFLADVKPILEAECISCHNGLYSPNLATCGDVSTFAASVREKITDERDPMPPDGLLPQHQIDVILKWIEQGADCDGQ